MELEHRFEVPVGIDQAWPHLLDMEKVAACFPGATLSSADGDEYTGTVKVKLGPIQLTYAGAARIVSADEATHTATIDASGTAARSGSTASMKVVAVASAVSESLTAVEMKTDLTITGRPAQFGRGVMVEVGNKILGKFADCLSAKLAEAEGAGSPQAGTAESNSEDAAGGAGSPQVGTGESKLEDAAAPAEGPVAASGSTYTRTPQPEVEAIDLLESARGSIIKRLIPVVAGLVALCITRLLIKRRRAKRAGS